jgi:para-nitrobenzyl esterase
MALTPTPFSPVVDGDVLPQSPWTALCGGAARGVELLTGHTRDEYRQLAVADVTDEQVTAVLDRLAPGEHGSAAYRAAHPGATAAELHEMVMADWLMRMPTLHLAEAQVAGGGRAWTYELCWGFGPQGASHSLDVLLVLGTIHHGDELRRTAARPTAAAEAELLAKRMRADWLAFAASGDPGWAPYDPHTRTTCVYDARPSTGPYPEEVSRRIWHEHRFDTLDLPTRTRQA